MPPVFHVLLLVFSVACFGIDAWMNPGPTKVTCAGLFFLAASFISW
jgi:hypothetical protein